MCYTILESTNELIVLKRGESGYYPQNPNNAPWSADNCDILNERLGVTKGQEMAMSWGSMHRWDVAMANPNNYTDNGD